MTEQEKLAAAQGMVKARIGFYIHLAVYIVVNALLIAVNLATSPNTLWFRWPLLGWGLGVLFHLLLLLLLPKGTRIKRRMIEREMKERAFEQRKV